MKLIVSSRLNYLLAKPTNFIFQVHAASLPTQTVANERFSISTNPPIAIFEALSSLNRVVRTKLGAGQSIIDYCSHGT